jgi:CheY-like chemotaxis protein
LLSPQQQPGLQPQVPSKQRLPQVLLVEDNAGDVGLVQEALLQHGVACDVVVAVDGERAIEFICDVGDGLELCPDLIILDLNLPRRSGAEVLASIRSRNLCAHVPIVVLTSSDNRKDREQVALYKPSAYIKKPSRLDEFMDLGATFREMLSPSH